MADKTRVLIVTQEMTPYTTDSIIADISKKLPVHLQENGIEIRILMPRFGTINERRHRLHEVVRLSGMNIIVDEDDYPLMIKVATLPGTRMQVYFLDNEDFFKRKYLFEDKNGKPFEDNPDRMAFFCKGVIETVKKFGWAPDIIHCHGWMTSLVPAYLRSAYKTEPLFQNAKVIYSAYNDTLEETFDDSFFHKATINNLTEKDLSSYKNEKGITLNSGAVTFADGIILAESDVKIDKLPKNKPVIDHESEDYLNVYYEFIQQLLEKEEA